MKLIFVYNADGTFAAMIKDTVHKLVAPRTYQCNLCRITYPRFTMDPRWREFVESLPYKIEFLHRDEFRAQYPNWKYLPLPAVLLHNDDKTKILIDHNEINTAKSIPELVRIVREHLVI